MHVVRCWFAATFTLAALLCSARAQTIEGQPIASQFGEYRVTDQGNGFSFSPDQCNVFGGGRNFPAFTTGVPVKLVDPRPAFSEVSTGVTAFVTGSYCAVSLSGLVYQHAASFYLTSGTGGLQEALSNSKMPPGATNTILLNARWYELIQPRSAATVIASVVGSTSFGLVDITTEPYTNYSWNGSQYVTVAATGAGATFPSADGLVYSTSTTASRIATSADVSGLIAGATVSPAVLNETVYAAGEIGAGIGIAQTAWSSSFSYPQCQAVSSGGNNYLAVAASTNVNPGTNPSIWWQVPNAGTPTNGDCAFYVAASLVTGTAGAELILPPGNTNTCIGFMEPTVAGPGLANVVIQGAGKAASVLTQTCNIVSSGNAVVQQPNSTVAYAYAGIDWEDFAVNANFLASAAMNVYGAQQFKIKHIHLENPADGSDHYIEFGHPAAANHTLAWAYEMDLEDIDTLDAHGPGSGANITASVSGGVPGFTVVSGGNSFNAAYSQLILSGTGAGADTPCTNRGTDTVHVAGGAITSITTTATGCSSPLYAAVFGGNAVTYCFKFSDASDSKMIMGLNPSECNTGVYNSNITSLMSFNKTHVIGTLVGISDAGTNSYWATQMDSIYRYGFDFEGANNVDNVYGSKFEWATNLLPGSSDYHFGTIANSPVNAPYAVNIFGDACGNAATFNGYNHFLPASGNVESSGGVLPAFVHAYDSQSCDQTASTANAANYIGQNFSIGNGTAGAVFNFGLGNGLGGAINLTYPSNSGIYDWDFQNATPATNSNNYGSPQLQLAGNYWNGTASTPSYVELQTIFGSGSNPAETLQFTMGGTPSSGVKAYSFDNPVAAPNITGSSLTPGNCVQAGTGGILTTSGTPCSTGGGAVNSVANTDATLTVSPTTGGVVASLALGHANTWTAPVNATNVGTFGATNYSSYLNSIVSGSLGSIGNCNLNGAWYQSITSAVYGCVTAPAPGTGPRNTAGGTFIAYGQDNSASYYMEPVGIIAQGIALANGASVYGANFQASEGSSTCCTSGLVIAAQENDLSAFSGPSAYSSGVGYRATLGFTNGHTGQYPFDGLQVSSNQAGAYWRDALVTYVGAIGPSGSVLNINAIGDATSSSGNYNCPKFMNIYETYWTGSAEAHEQWTWNCTIGAGATPNDTFSIANAGGATGASHYFDLAGGILLELDGSTSGSAYLSAAATGGTLNLGSTNATVDTSGNLSVASCTGCGPSAPPWSAITSGANTQTGAFSTAGRWSYNAAGTASTAGLSITGAPYTAGTVTTNFPQLYVNQGAAATTLSTAGTEFGINAPSGFVGHLINLFVNGGSTRFRVDYLGNTFIAGTETVASTLGLSSTTAPAVVNGAGAGTSPGTPVITGNNNSGVITVITGTATTASATLATITFNGTLGTVPNGCGLTPRNAAATGSSLVYTTAPTSTNFAIALGGTAAAASTTYIWSYLCL